MQQAARRFANQRQASGLVPQVLAVQPKLTPSGHGWRGPPLLLACHGLSWLVPSPPSTRRPAWPVPVVCGPCVHHPPSVQPSPITITHIQHCTLHTTEDAGARSRSTITAARRVPSSRKNSEGLGQPEDQIKRPKGRPTRHARRSPVALTCRLPVV